MMKKFNNSITPIEAFYLIETQIAMNTLHDVTCDKEIRELMDKSQVIENDDYYACYSCLDFDEIANRLKDTDIPLNWATTLRHEWIPCTFINYLKLSCITAILNAKAEFAKDPNHTGFWKDGDWVVYHYVNDETDWVNIEYVLDMECSRW